MRARKRVGIKPVLKNVHYVLDRKEAKGLIGWRSNEGWKSKLVWMSPQDFLNKVPPIVYSAEAYNKLKAKMSRGVPLDPLFYDIKGGKITNHEGRHRALVARDLGVRQVPVIVYQIPVDW